MYRVSFLMAFSTTHSHEEVADVSHSPIVQRLWNYCNVLPAYAEHRLTDRSSSQSWTKS